MLPFVWFGMVSAISFLETPLKFRAPGMTHALGVGIGRLVFKVLNLVEAAMAKRTKALSLTAVTHDGGTAVRAKVATTTHPAYISSEAVKVLALPIAGILIALGVAA